MTKENSDQKDGHQIEISKILNFAKQIEASGVPLSTGKGEDRKPNLELAGRFQIAFKKATLKVKEERSFKNKIFKNMKKLLNILANKSKAKDAKILESKRKEREENQGKQASGSFGMSSVDNLSAEIERQTIKLKSASTIDSSQNDARILEDIVKLTKLVSSANGPSQAPKMKVEVEKAVTSIANIAVTYKYNSPSTALIAEGKDKLDKQTESIGESTNLKMDKNTGEVDVIAKPKPSIRDSLKKNTSDIVSNKDLPITNEARLRKERANKEFSSYRQPGE